MPKESMNLLRELEAIEPSEFEPGTRIYPCSALLNDGTVLECVYFVSADTAKRLFGPAGIEAVSERLRIPVEQVANVGVSPARLPARFANQIYQAGETHYGCYMFTLVFSRWRREKYSQGGFIDFLSFPRGRRPCDVKEVLLRTGPIRASRVMEYRWCVYSG